MHRPARLNYFTGNRLELLADRLAEELEADPLGPASRETILVPSRGMGSWLTRHLALRWGIAASLDLPFPARFVDRLAERFGLGRPEPVDPFRPVAQLFELHELFWKIENEGPQANDLKAVADHLRDDHDGRKRYQLGRRVSHLFAGYQFARPEEIERWRSGGWFSADGPIESAGEGWQRALFMDLATRHEAARPPAQRILELVRKLGRGEFEPGDLPERVAIFGASTLPPMIAQVLGALAQHRPVDFYMLVPTAGYLADLQSRRERDREEYAADLTPAEELVGELGRLGREFFSVLLDLDPAGAAIEEAGFESPGTGTVLHHLQSSLLDPAIPPSAFDATDRSLRLHSCHSPMREMEVLRDEVLAALADGTAGSVTDVLLLVPDIRKYAPLARSVFGGAIENGDRTLQLPLRIADRSGASDQPFARLAIQWLELAASRLTLSEVFPVLQEQVVRARFGFGDEQLDSMRDRLREAGVIWGVDPAQRARQTGTPEFEGVSWREGIDRLLLGCFTGPVEHMIAGVLPSADATVGDTAMLGELATALDRLFALLSDLDGPHPMEEWAARIRGGLLSLTDAGDERGATQRADCLGVLDRLTADAAASPAPIGRLALLDLLRREFSAMDSGAGFVSGMVTVAELRPMRSLPASVIAVAGLDADSFPRRDPEDGLDLVKAHRRRGDRSPRDDDRQLFLELLLCARDRLILSWVGHSQKDDHERTLSPCVQELVDTLKQLGFEGHTTQHSLQPFVSISSEESTYDHSTVRASEALQAPVPVPRFLDVSVTDEPGPGVERIALADLRAFWKSPAEWFCKQVLELSLARDREEPEAEALGLDALQKWKLRNLGIERRGELPADPELRSQLGLPANPLVAIETDAIRAEFSIGDLGFVEEAVEVAGADFIVDGTLRRQKDGSVFEIVAASSVKPKYRVSALVAHAVASAAGIEAPTMVGPVGKPKDVQSWIPLADADTILARLVEGYRAGQHQALHFFPRTSMEFAKQHAKFPQDPLELFRSAKMQAVWAAPAEDALYGDAGECFDEAVALCMRGLDDAAICNEEFAAWSEDFARWLNATEGKW